MITLVIGFTAGSSSDVFGRFYAKKLSSLIGQSVVVENRLGAAGLVGANSVLRAPANGRSQVPVKPNLHLLTQQHLTDSQQQQIARSMMKVSLHKIVQKRLMKILQ